MDETNSKNTNTSTGRISLKIKIAQKIKEKESEKSTCLQGRETLMSKNEDFWTLYTMGKIGNLLVIRVLIYSTKVGCNFS